MKDYNNCNIPFVTTEVESIYTKGEKGDKGERGERGLDGKDGYTPIKGVDYFDGAKGDKGDAGVKGDTGVGIQSISANEDASVTVTLTDGTIQTTEPLIDTSYSGIWASTEW